MTGRHFSRYFFLFAALACSTLALSKPNDRDKNKDKDQGKENNSEVKFTARTELVLIPTVVTDKSGNHVTGLKPEDFTVLENGAEQKIATFEEITSDAHFLSRPRNPNEFSNSVAGSPGSRPPVALRSSYSTY